MPINKGYLTAKTDKASDEVYTPVYAITPLIKYINNYMERDSFAYSEEYPLIIWCPFDLANSKYVEVLS